MNETDPIQRLEAKTPQQHFLRVLEQDYRLGARVAAAILQEAQSCLRGSPTELGPGQIRVFLTRRTAAAGQPLEHTPTTPVTWTLDAGLEDRQVLAEYGGQGLRQVRLQRLLDEAFEQGALASQEDLAQVLHVSVRTIKRDFARLQQQGHWLPSRGAVLGVGRGQTHKAQIVGRWLQGETYDQLARHTRHCASSIQRYVQAFVQVVRLQRLGFSEEQIAPLVQMGQPLVRDYLAIAARYDTPLCRERLESQLERLGRSYAGQKGAR